MKSINQPIAPEELTVHFPEWIQVIDNDVHKNYIQGKEGPIVTFNTPQECEDWYYIQRRARFVQFLTHYGPFFVVAIVLILGGWLLYRRHRAKKDASAEPQRKIAIPTRDGL